MSEAAVLWMYAEADAEHRQASTAQAIHGTDIVVHYRVFVDIAVDERSKLFNARPIRKELLEKLVIRLLFTTSNTMEH